MNEINLIKRFVQDRIDVCDICIRDKRAIYRNNLKTHEIHNIKQELLIVKSYIDNVSIKSVKVRNL